MRDIGICLAFVLAFTISFCGGPQFVADLIKPSLGQAGVWVAFAPLTIAGVGACYFLELSPIRPGLVNKTFRWGSYTVRAGVAGMLLVTLMNAFALWHLAVGPGHPNRSLVVFGSIVGLVLAAVYVRLALLHRRLPMEPVYRTYRCLAPRLAAQFVLSDAQAYLAYSADRRPSGPDGETRIAFILHTQDGGASWTRIPWRRSLWSCVRHPIQAWPPEAVVSMEYTPQGLRIAYWEELFEPAGELRWQGTFVDGKWSSRRLRSIHEGQGSPSRPPELRRDMPPGMQPPQFGNIAIIVETRTLPF